MTNSYGRRWTAAPWCRLVAVVLLGCCLVSPRQSAQAADSLYESDSIEESTHDGSEFASPAELHHAMHRTHAHPHMLRGHPQHMVRLQAGVLELKDDMLTAGGAGAHPPLRELHTMALPITSRARPPHKYFRASFFHGHQHGVHTTRHTLGRPQRMNRFRPNDGLDDEAMEVHLHRPNEATWKHMREYFEDEEEHAKRFVAMYDDSVCQSNRDNDEDCLRASSPLHPLHTHPKFHYQWLIHLKSPITQLAIDTVERIIHPYKLVHYLPHSSYLVSLPYAVALRLQRGVDEKGEKVSNSVLFIAMYHPSMKVQQDIHALISRRWKQKLAIREKTIAKHGEDAPARKRALAHELRVTFTHPSFSPSSPPSHSSLFPSHRQDLLLTRAYSERQMKAWKGNERFLEKMANATVGDVDGKDRKRMYDSISAIQFIPLDSTQIVIRLPAELADPAEDGSESFLAHFIGRLSKHHSIQYIESHAVHTVSNKHARFVVQADLETGDLCTDTSGSTELNAHELSSTVGFEAPFYSALHLYGQEQIVAIGDTGVDFDSCFFHDRQNPNIALNSKGMAHRKVIAYITAPVSDAPNAPRATPGDDEGHGTHTAGSLAGSPGPWPEDVPNSRDTSTRLRSFPPDRPGIDRDTFEALANYSGIAPQARMIIFDFQNPGDGALYVPNDIYHDYLALSEQYGAMVSSNSWGDDSGVYDAYTRDVDTYLYEHPEYFMVMAAGNGGGHGMHTIATPAVAKNLLTVGSSMNGVCSFYDQGSAVGWIIRNDSLLNFFPPAGHSITGRFPVTPASFGTPFREVPRITERRACYATPKQACGPLENAADCHGKVIFVERGGGCAFSVKAKNVLEAGGILMAYLHDSAEANFILDAPEYITSLPVITIDLSVGQYLRQMFQGVGGQVEIGKLTFEYPVYYPTTTQSEYALSDFSAKGPTLDGRIKPDLLAPGQLIESVAGDRNLHTFQCSNAMGPWDDATKKRRFIKGSNIVPMQGTSMACPIATGAAVLIRQYLTEEGHYTDPLTGEYKTWPAPSSALMKALMISGTSPISGSVLAGTSAAWARIPVPPPPNYLQGFGRLEMSEVLAYDFEVDGDGRGRGNRTARSKYHLFATDEEWITTGGVQRWCFRVTDSTVPFKATLAWADPPPILPTNLFLVNDLDLMIVGHDVTAQGKSKAYVGNARLRSEESRSNGETGDYQALNWDTNNNVEKAIVETPTADRIYSVVVRGTHVPISGPSPAAAASKKGQMFALVVNGAFQMQAACPKDVACPSACSGHGECMTSGANAGVCRCSPNWAGADCASPAPEMFAGALLTDHTVTTHEVRLEIQPDEWTFLTHTVQRGETSLVWTMETLNIPERQGDPDFYFTAPFAAPSPLTYPTLGYFQFANTDCDTCKNVQRVHRQEFQTVTLYKPSDRTHQGGGQVVLGIWGYCCEPSSVKITLDRTFA
jgi:subtilisin family serine protease